MSPSQARKTQSISCKHTQPSITGRGAQTQALNRTFHLSSRHPVTFINRREYIIGKTNHFIQRLLYGHKSIDNALRQLHPALRIKLFQCQTAPAHALHAVPKWLTQPTLSTMIQTMNCTTRNYNARIITIIP